LLVTGAKDLQNLLWPPKLFFSTARLDRGFGWEQRGSLPGDPYSAKLILFPFFFRSSPSNKVLSLAPTKPLFLGGPYPPSPSFFFLSSAISPLPIMDVPGGGKSPFPRPGGNPHPLSFSLRPAPFSTSLQSTGRFLKRGATSPLFTNLGSFPCGGAIFSFLGVRFPPLVEWLFSPPPSNSSCPVHLPRFSFKWTGLFFFSPKERGTPLFVELGTLTHPGQEPVLPDLHELAFSKRDRLVSFLRTLLPQMPVPLLVFHVPPPPWIGFKVKPPPPDGGDEGIFPVLKFPPEVSLSFPLLNRGVSGRIRLPGRRRTFPTRTSPPLFPFLSEGQNRPPPFPGRIPLPWNVYDLFGVCPDPDP